MNERKSVIWCCVCKRSLPTEDLQLRDGLELDCPWCEAALVVRYRPEAATLATKRRSNLGKAALVCACQQCPTCGKVLPPLELTEGMEVQCPHCKAALEVREVSHV